MKELKWKYEYEDIEQGSNQYSPSECMSNGFVDAKYVKYPSNHLQGNPFIEALPNPRFGDVLIKAYYEPIIGFDKKRIDKMSYVEKRASCIDIRNVRLPLMFQQSLETVNYEAIVRSYSLRNTYVWKNDSFDITMDGIEQTVASKSKGEVNNSAPSGFSLLGYSGCGKSTSLKSLFNNIPQVIIHHPNEYTQIPQITYLVVSCIANSNFQGLYNEIGKAIDTALGNGNPVYQSQIEKKKSLAAKQEYICQLIELFHIGTIVLDEIQLIDFDANKENSYEGLLTIVNNTKVALSVVGTDEAYSKLFGNLRNARRSGIFIPASQYTEDKEFFKTLTQMLFQWQWFKKPIPWTEELNDTLYECSKGLIDTLTWIYKYMMLDYIDAVEKGKHPTINSDYIQKVSKRHFRNIKSHLDLIEFKKEENIMHEQMINDVVKARENPEEFLKGVKSLSSKETKEELNRLDTIINMVKTIYTEFSNEMISTAYQQIITKYDDSSKLTDQQVAQDVIKVLQGEKVTKRRIKKKKKQTSTDIMDYLNL